MAAAVLHDSQQPRLAVDAPSVSAATASVTAAAAAAAVTAVISIDFHRVQHRQHPHHCQQQQQQEQQQRPLEMLACRFEALTPPSARSREEVVSGAGGAAECPADCAQQARPQWSSASERASRAFPVSADPHAWRRGGSCGDLASELRSADCGGSTPGCSDGHGDEVCREVSQSLRVKDFAEACDGIGQLFSVLGPAFSFAGKEFVEKVADLHVAGDQFATLADMMAEDLRSGVARVKGSHTRNLLRVVRGLDLNRRIFALLLHDCGQPLRVYAGRAYSEVFSAVHPWPVRSLVAAGLYTLPSTPAFLLLLGESDDGWRQRAEQLVAALSPVIQAVDHLFVSRGLGLHW